MPAVLSRTSPRIVTSVAIAAAVTMLIGGCATSSAPDAAPNGAEPAGLAATLPQSVLDRGKIVAYMQTPAPPFEWRDEKSGKLTGIDVDFLDAISDVIGFPIEVTEVSDFATLVPSIQSGRADIVMSGLLDKAERQKGGDFIDYLHGGTSFWTVADAPYSEYEDFCGETVVTATGSDYVQQLEALSDEICPADSPIDVLAITGAFASEYDQVKQGRAVAIVQGPDFIGYEAVNNYPGELKMVGDIFNPNVYGIMVGLELPELRDAVETAMKQLVEDGTYLEILKKYGQEAGAVEAITVNSATA